MTARELIEDLQLLPHPEGGYYKEIYRSNEVIAANCLPASFGGQRNCCTSIYYLLQEGDFSAFHRIKSDEIWHFYAGRPLLLHLLDEQGHYQSHLLGNDLKNGALYQVVMPAGVWFAAEPAPGTGFTLAGCTVSPGFDFHDFTLADQSLLIKAYPEHREIIQRLCR